MARGSLLGARKTRPQPAAPKGDSVTETETRVDVLAKALSDAGEGANDSQKTEAAAPKKKVQRSREGLVSTSVWMTPEARKELKLYTQIEDTGLERWIIDAMNEKLERDGATARDGHGLRIAFSEDDKAS